MKQKFEKQLITQKSIITVMENNVSSWQNIVELKNNYDRFVKNYKKITDCETELRFDPAEIYMEGNKSKEELIEKLFPIASLISVYASDLGDKKLHNQSNIKFTQLEKKKSKALLRIVSNILTFAGKLMGKGEKLTDASGKKKKTVKSITDYGLTEKHLKDLKAASDTYCEKVKSIRIYRVKKAACKKNVEALLLKNEKILKRKLDKFMTLFQESNKTFYDNYWAARSGEALSEADKSIPLKGTEPEKASAPQKTGTKNKPIVRTKVKANGKTPVSGNKKASETAKTTSGPVKTD